MILEGFSAQLVAPSSRAASPGVPRQQAAVHKIVHGGHIYMPRLVRGKRLRNIGDTGMQRTLQDNGA